ncbi:unnamed protein product, partial [Scytosiphon promiscuus]
DRTPLGTVRGNVPGTGTANLPGAPGFPCSTPDHAPPPQQRDRWGATFHASTRKREAGCAWSDDYQPCRLPPSREGTVDWLDSRATATLIPGTVFLDLLLMYFEVYQVFLSRSPTDRLASLLKSMPQYVTTLHPS